MRKPCCDKQRDKNKGAWSKQEDQKLITYIQTHGEGCWRSLPQAAGLLRCGKSCRLRWINYLRPDLKRGNFGEDEEDLIIKLHALLGNRWSLIAGRLPGRTDNEVKNYWNSHLRRKLIRMGIDPNNHRLGNCISRHLQKQVSHATTTSSTSKTKPCLTYEPAKPHGIVNVQVSDTKSFVEDGDTSTVPDLNLDLTMNIPYHCDTRIDEENKQQNVNSNIASTELLNELPTPALVLFR
ncbi:hypothetical protein GIB67_025653 [Kingdonia uniflora]|uniref:Uncharacterized protein n=1 Tax=Kingdonia uniflora TaxID=39325 RepID=A0A7J7L8P1_9MAGN|nr:hypothetical protein GIB67_025653 [Kingdonia uniflora]